MVWKALFPDSRSVKYNYNSSTYPVNLLTARRNKNISVEAYVAANNC